ncbi:MAG TPA: hypothetical protein VIL42_10830 [Sphingomicrobium sp.]
MGALIACLPMSATAGGVETVSRATVGIFAYLPPRVTVSFPSNLGINPVVCVSGKPDKFYLSLDQSDDVRATQTGNGTCAVLNGIGGKDAGVHTMLIIPE